ncbi:MAG: ABC transporter permease [Treponema sp.]|nr:ABC transporter permease [Treponema sp.]
MNAYYIGSALNLSALYMIAGSGAAVSIKSGDFNLGGEGQIYLGGFISAVILGFGTKIALLPAPIAVFLAISAAFLLTAVIALISALLKIFRRADFLFTSFITSAALIPFIDGLIAGPARSKTDNLLATPFIGAAVRLKQLLPPSPLNTSFIFAIALCAGLWLALNRTSWGRQLCVLGISPDFARFAGYDRRALGCGAAVISGGLHGLCGAAAILGTYFSCHQGFYSGIGWNAFSAALIARANPIFLIPSSLFLGFITTYANKFAMYHNFGFDISSLIQAVVMFIIAFPLVRKNGDKTL